MTPRNSRLTAVLGLGALLSVASLQAQSAAGGGSSTLTDRDRAEIRELVARYAQALGSCAAEDYASSSRPTAPSPATTSAERSIARCYGPEGTLQGRDQLAQLVRTEEFCLDGKPRPLGVERPASHGDDPAEPRRGTGSAPIGAGGRYDDVYVKTADGWRFKSRTVTMPPRRRRPDGIGAARRAPSPRATASGCTTPMPAAAGRWCSSRAGR